MDPSRARIQNSQTIKDSNWDPKPWYSTVATRTFVQLGEGLPFGEVRLLALVLRGEGEEDLLQAAVAVAVAIIVCQVRVLEPCTPTENTKSMSFSRYKVLYRTADEHNFTFESENQCLPHLTLIH